MKVKEILISALKILGRNELAAQLSDGGALSAEDNETLETLLYCFNATEDEVARSYVPLTSSEEFISKTNRFLTFLFRHPPARVVRVVSDGKEIPFEVYPDHVYADATEVTIDYEYAPTKKTASDEISYGEELSGNVFVYGTVAEYCLINGEISASDLWESKYRKAVDSAQQKLAESKNASVRKPAAGGYIPPRRWV